MEGKDYRHTASFGKRAEYFIIAQMLKEGLDCYVPLVDDEGIDVVVKKDDKTFVMVQIKAGSKCVWFNGYRINKKTGKKEEYIKEQFQQYVYTDFKKIIS